MIHSFDIKDPAKTHIPWLAKVPALAKPRTFEFGPGLNVLWGPNGSGKTTVVKALARLFHCEQGGVPFVTETSLQELFYGPRSRIKEPSDLLEGMVLQHDGQGVRYFDPSVATGLAAGGAAFDWDFGTEGLSNVMFKGSAGQTTMFRFDSLLKAMRFGQVPEVKYKVHEDRVNDVWAGYLRVAKKFLDGSGEKGLLTILLDEPERSFDLPTQVAIWRYIRSYAAKFQIIVASHSFFALNIPEAKYIEMGSGYLSRSLACLALLQKWGEEDPIPIPPLTKAEMAQVEKEGAGTGTVTGKKKR
jgi:predicted ATPase